MRKRMPILVLILSLLLNMFAVYFLPTITYAETSREAACKGIGGDWKDVGTPEKPDYQCDGGNNGGKSLTNFVKQIINVLLFIAGMVAVIMIVIGGLRYITSDGDSGRITQAKQTVLYAIIGLIVAILAYAIVNFVISNL